MGTTVTLLLGRAGAGKTERCLREIREELQRRPDGLPLVLLAPRQATFQLERRLLAGAPIAGYTRLVIASFERLSNLILNGVGRSPDLLSDEGRTMVLRALLQTHRHRLEVFRASARMPGFAAELGQLLRDCHRHRLDLSRLTGALATAPDRPLLRRKLADLALLQRLYGTWLAEHQLADNDQLLEAATAALPRPETQGPLDFRLAGLWMDGFAELTPQELELLGKIIPRSTRVTLAFCLGSSPGPDPSWASLWGYVRHTQRQCGDLLSGLADCAVTVETLTHHAGRGRFRAPALAALEQCLAQAEIPGRRQLPEAEVQEAVRIVVAEDPAREAIVAAREIRRHVMRGGRYRACGVVLRRLETHADIIRRVFRRYEIPFFLDQREGVAHHPLAEFTRCAIRTVAYSWLHNDWFGALKTGLTQVDETTIDRLENESLARGWEGPQWIHGFAPSDPSSGRPLERARRKLIRPFVRLGKKLGLDLGGSKTSKPLFASEPTGHELTRAIREFWEESGVEHRLRTWSQASADDHRGPLPLHLTVWRQMQEWLDNIALAFAHERMPVREWLPVIESGLSRLTAGVIPPGLDQVLVGAVDRSRNPELELVVVLGFNETLFPAPAPSPGLLTEGERSWIAEHGFALGPDPRRQLARERYYAYVALTRASRRLVVTYARRDTHGQPLNPSGAITWLERAIPGCARQDPSAAADEAEAVHASECLERALATLQPALSLRGTPTHTSSAAAAARLSTSTSARAPGNRPAPGVAEQGTIDPIAVAMAAEWPAFHEPLQRLVTVSRAYAARPLEGSLVRALYGDPLELSITALERFAACPFQQFARMLGDERTRFELDARQLGTFHHEVLAAFDRDLKRDKLRWRDVTPQDAEQRIACAAQTLLEGATGDLFRAHPRHQLFARGSVRRLQAAVGQMVRWMASYRFDPVAVEVGFGGHDAALPGWDVCLEDGTPVRLRGKIDRIDVACVPQPEHPGPPEAWAIVMDYKSGSKRFDELLFQHGIQLQLPAYLTMLGDAPDVSEALGTRCVRPAGMFYLNLRGDRSAAADRLELCLEEADAMGAAYRHYGRFRWSLADLLDSGVRHQPSGQFAVRLLKNGRPYSHSHDPMEDAAFEALLRQTRALVRSLAGRIHAGEAAVDPYRRTQQTPCRFCSFAAACRIDPWTHRYRPLRSGAFRSG